MTAVVWVGAVIAGLLTLSASVAIPTGKALHRAGHRQDEPVTPECPDWCLRERAARVLRDRP